MVEIPDRLRCLYSAILEQRGDSYLLEVPHEELDHGNVVSDESYRVAVLSQSDSQLGAPTDEGHHQRSGSAGSDERGPPVEEGDVCEVTIETIGDQGDGIAKVERGYVVIVPGARPDDEVTVEIEQARENVAFARVRTDKSMSDTPSDEESFEDTDDTLDESDELP